MIVQGSRGNSRERSVIFSPLAPLRFLERTEARESSMASSFLSNFGFDPGDSAFRTDLLFSREGFETKPVVLRGLSSKNRVRPGYALNQAFRLGGYLENLWCRFVVQS